MKPACLMCAETITVMKDCQHLQNKEKRHWAIKDSGCLAWGGEGGEKKQRKLSCNEICMKLGQDGAQNTGLPCARQAHPKNAATAWRF